MPNYKPVSDTDNCPDESLDASDDSPENSASTENETEATETDTGDTDSEGESTGHKHSYDNGIGHNGEYQNGGLNTIDDSNGEVKDKNRRRRAETARDLVQSQENLILMLQRMKSDLSSMDREATSIKEEVIRSRQLFDVCVGHRRVHQLDYSANGYNLTYAMPKVSYNYNKSLLNGSHSRCSNLSQSSTYCNYSPNVSRRSSVSGTSSRKSSYQNEIEPSRSRFRQNSERIAQTSDRKTSQSEEFSVTESEYDSEREPSWSSYPTGMSTDSSVFDSPVTNRSAERRTKRLSDYRSKSLERKSSYFFTNKTETPEQDVSDDVCV